MPISDCEHASLDIQIKKQESRHGGTKKHTQLAIKNIAGKTILTNGMLAVTKAVARA